MSKTKTHSANTNTKSAPNSARQALKGEAPRLHPAIAAAVTFTGLTGALAVGVHVFGDPEDAQARAIAPLFLEGHEQPPAIKVSLDEPPLMDPNAMPVLHAEESILPVDDLPGAGDAGQDEAAGHPEAPRKPRSPPLSKAPIAGLTKPGPDGPVPAIGPNGLTSAKAYARPFKAVQGKPRIGIIVGGLGLNARATQDAIEELPPDVTLSFVPYAANLQQWIDRAREYGHEVILELPMEPFDYPDNDTGPYTLLASGGAENLSKLDWLMSRATGYFAVTNYLGARFANNASASGPIFRTLKARGVSFVQTSPAQRGAFAAEAKTSGLEFTAADRVIDANPNAQEIDDQLLHLEALALQKGAALGAGFAYPVTVEQIKVWAEGLTMKGYQLAPASAVLEGRMRNGDQSNPRS